MKIDQLELVNFKGFKKNTFHFNENNILLSAENGNGKSSILEAINLCLSKLASNYVPTKPIVFSDDMIRNKTSQSSIEMRLLYKNKPVSFSLKKRRSSKSRGVSSAVFDKQEVGELINDFRAVIDNESGNIPIIVYYPTQRNVIDVPSRIRTKHEFDQVSSYEDAFKSGVNFRTFFEWYRDEEDMENEGKLSVSLNHEDKKLAAVRKAIYSFLPGFSNLRIVRSRQKMSIEKNGEALAINQLSDGEKCLLALIGDLARRLALANPSLNDPLFGEGIVLIDEIDLHLHPSLQRKVMESLPTIFPNIQFILTTHSPQVMGSANDFKVFLLENQESLVSEKITNANLYGKDSNLILESYMGTSSSDKEVQQMLDKLFVYLSTNDINKSKEMYNALLKILDSIDPDLKKAEYLINRLERVNANEKNS